MNRKTRFIMHVLSLLFSIGMIIREVRDLAKVYIDRGYAPGGSDPITDADLTDVAFPDGAVVTMTVADFNTCATLLTQVLNFASNKAVTTADYEATINRFRTDT